MVVAAMVVAIAGWASRKIPPPPVLVLDEATFASKPHTVFELALDAAGRRPEATVVGTMRRFRARHEDTFVELGRYFDVGLNEMVAANPGVDPWVPGEGTEVLIPTRWVLPCCTYEGIVVNVPEMRLYYYEPAGPGRLRVYTYPVGVGREERPTPQGVYRVAAKSEKPTWVIPESIRREHIRESGDHRRSIPGGDPDNPLGNYRLTLSKPRYAIHGTNIPWGPGMPVSHGCVRLFPEDIERVYPVVPVGARVELTYQPVKLGLAGGRTWVEVHEDVYARTPLAEAARQAAVRHPDAAVNTARLEAAMRGVRGVPIPVGP
jgi:L,D-transpeptidase ErfK/SrfK